MGEAQMKLTWKPGNSLRIAYVADGKDYSYQISFNAISEQYRVLKLRQSGGQILNSTFALTIDGAMARAQTWENADGQAG